MLPDGATVGSRFEVQDVRTDAMVEVEVTRIRGDGMGIARPVAAAVPA